MKKCEWHESVGLVVDAIIGGGGGGVMSGWEAEEEVLSTLELITDQDGVKSDFYDAQAPL